MTNGCEKGHMMITSLILNIQLFWKIDETKLLTFSISALDQYEIAKFRTNSKDADSSK